MVRDGSTRIKYRRFVLNVRVNRTLNIIEQNPATFLEIEVDGSVRVPLDVGNLRVRDGTEPEINTSPAYRAVFHLLARIGRITLIFCDQGALLVDVFINAARAWPNGSMYSFFAVRR